MATVNDGFIGGFRGRMGNVVGYVWRGKYCVRSLPGEFHDAKTPMQMEQRSLFRQTIRFASRARKVLLAGLHTQSVNSHLTEYNYFMRINKRCFALEDNVLQVDYENLLLSDGPVAPVAFGVPTMLDDRTISIDFEKNPLHRAVSSEDRVYLAAYCPEL